MGWRRHSASLALLLLCGFRAAITTNALGEESRPVAIPIKHADALHIADRVKAKFGFAAIIAVDTESNTVIVRANANQASGAETLVNVLDTPCRAHIVRLKHVDPKRAAQVMNSLANVLEYFAGEPEARFCACEGENSIFFTATDAQAKYLLWLVRSFDQDFSGRLDNRKPNGTSFK